MRSNRLSKHRHVYALSRPFALQYTSLILIILSCVIGAFAAKPLQTADFSPATIIEKHLLLPFPKKIGEISYGNLFAYEEAKVNAESADALVQFLKSHDLIAQVQIFRSISNGTQSLGVHRSTELFKYLTQRGVPPEALDIVASGKESEEQVKVRFIEDGA